MSNLGPEYDYSDEEDDIDTRHVSRSCSDKTEYLVRYFQVENAPHKPNDTIRTFIDRFEKVTGVIVTNTPFEVKIGSNIYKLPNESARAFSKNINKVLREQGSDWHFIIYPTSVDFGSKKEYEISEDSDVTLKRVSIQREKLVKIRQHYCVRSAIVCIADKIKCSADGVCVGNKDGAFTVDQKSPFCEQEFDINRDGVHVVYWYESKVEEDAKHSSSRLKTPAETIKSVGKSTSEFAGATKRFVTDVVQAPFNVNERMDGGARATRKSYTTSSPSSSSSSHMLASPKTSTTKKPPIPIRRVRLDNSRP